MIRTTTRSIRAATAIRDRESFTTNGALRGQKYPDGGLGPGAVYNSWLDDDNKDQWYLDCYYVDYVVWSYATPIAWHYTRDDGVGGWHVVAQKFSPTTGKHQSNLYMIPREDKATA